MPTAGPRPVTTSPRCAGATTGPRPTATGPTPSSLRAGSGGPGPTGRDGSPTPPAPPRSVGSALVSSRPRPGARPARPTSGEIPAAPTPPPERRRGHTPAHPRRHGAVVSSRPRKLGRLDRRVTAPSVEPRAPASETRPGAPPRSEALRPGPRPPPRASRCGRGAGRSQRPWRGLAPAQRGTSAAGGWTVGAPRAAQAPAGPQPRAQAPPHPRAVVSSRPRSGARPARPTGGARPADGAQGVRCARQAW